MEQEIKWSWYNEKYHSFGELIKEGKLDEMQVKMGVKRESLNNICQYLKKEGCFKEFEKGTPIEIISRKIKVKLETVRDYSNEYKEELEEREINKSRKE